MANKKNRKCKNCETMIWDTPIKVSSGLCKPCWGAERKGFKHTEETKQKLSKFRVKDPCYHTLHNRVYKLYGQPSECEHCSDTEAKMYHWASNGIYKIDRKNWTRLCVTCHHIYDGLAYS